MRNFGAMLLAPTLLASTILGGSAFGAENLAPGSLAPGQAAGTAEAQAKTNEGLYITTLGVILVGGVAFLISTAHSASTVTSFPGGSNTIVPVTDTVVTTSTTSTTATTATTTSTQ